jgi:hypothetical protein
MSKLELKDRTLSLSKDGEGVFHLNVECFAPRESSFSAWTKDKRTIKSEVYRQLTMSYCGLIKDLIEEAEIMSYLAKEEHNDL